MKHLFTWLWCIVNVVHAAHDLPLFSRWPTLRQSLPHVSLTTLPTPVQHMRQLGNVLGMQQLYVKRDDLSGGADRGITSFAGNKPRKLEFSLADAQQQEARTIITLGCAGSNHATATAMYAQQLGLNCVCLLRDQPLSPVVKRNLLLMHQAGAQLHWFPTWEARQQAIGVFSEELFSVDGVQPYVIPPGASHPIGIVGFVNAALELEEQVQQGFMPEPAYIYVAAGSLGTMVGLLLGLKLTSLGSQVIGIFVDPEDDPQECVHEVHRLFRKTNQLLRNADASFPLCHLCDNDVIIMHNFCGAAYGSATVLGNAAARLMATYEDIMLDDTYTAKALAGLFYDVQQRGAQNSVILFWNTFCSNPFAFTIDNVDYHALPSDFHRYFEN